MPRPYNKKTVADAIAMLDVYASNACTVEAAADAVGVRPSSTAYRVVDTMIDKLADMFPDDRLAYVAGEAAGLLREGWRLGDDIAVHPNVKAKFSADLQRAEHSAEGDARVPGHIDYEADTMYGVTRTSAPAGQWDVGHCASDEPKETTAEFDARPRTVTTADPLDQQYSAAVVIDAQTGAIVKDRYGEHDSTVQYAPEALADALDAVEEPSDEEIGTPDLKQSFDNSDFDPYANSPIADGYEGEPSE